METEKLVWSLLEGTSDLVQSITPDKHFEYVNKAWLETLGYSDAQARKLQLKDVVLPGFLKKVEGDVEAVLQGGSVKDTEITLVTRGGALVFVEGNMFPRYDRGKPTACQCILHDVTEGRRMREKLQEEQARAEFFVDLMIHDLTNIHQEIMSALEVLLMDSQFPKVFAGITKECLMELDKASRLVTSVRKLTMLSKPGRQTALYDLGRTLRKAAEDVAHSFPEKRLIFNTNVSDEQYWVSGDEFLPEVFMALIHNAMKFDQSTDVVVDVRIDVIPKTPFLRIQVMDHGPGIPDDQKEAVFNLLSPRRDSLRGLGLGLTLVKQVLSCHGAFIRVEDRVPQKHGEGASFVIVMRYEKAPSNDEKEPE